MLGQLEQATAGLGLAIARSLAQAHEGDVELETVLGEGACLRLTLPRLTIATIKV